jgi:outer membrane murein-binding lipoprotein Lpp
VPLRARRTAPLVVAAVVGAALLAGCGSSSSSHASSKIQGTTLQQDCTLVGDVLSDGPDPSADPVGYAEAQVLPLRQLKLTEPKLKTYVAELATAYENFSKSNGAAGTTDARAVSKLQTEVNSICPGAAS